LYPQRNAPANITSLSFAPARKNMAYVTIAAATPVAMLGKPSHVTMAAAMLSAIYEAQVHTWSLGRRSVATELACRPAAMTDNMAAVSAPMRRLFSTQRTAATPVVVRS